MDRQIRAIELFFRIEPQTNRQVQCFVHQVATHHCHQHAQQGAGDLRHQADASHATEGLEPEDAGSNSAPGTAQSVQRPDAEDIVTLPAVLREGKQRDEQAARDHAHNQCAEGMHHV